MAFFNKIASVPSDPVFGLAASYHADPRPHKINLIMGIYRTEDLQTPLLQCVKKAETLIIKEQKNKEYLPIEGSSHFLQLLGPLIFGENSWKELSEQTAVIQAIGGTGALRLGIDLLKMDVSSLIYYSDPTWVNHPQMATQASLQNGAYPYYDRKTHQLDFSNWLLFLEKLPAHSTILLHASCHNPTGLDPTPDQWRELSQLFLRKKLIPFFDFAYQGFGNGLKEDSLAIQIFANDGHEMLVASSFSKNFGLYGERVGALFVVTSSKKHAQNVLSNLKMLARTHYSNPPLHGERIVTLILNDPQLKQEWENEIHQMRERTTEMRIALAQALISQSKTKDYRYLTERTGLFCFCDLNKEQVDRLIHEYAIYLTWDGRINVTGLNHANLQRVVDAIIAVGEQ